MPQTHQISNVVRAVLNEPWLILEEKLEEISAFLELRAVGVQLDEADIQARFGSSKIEDKNQPQIIDGGIQVIDVFGTLMPRANMMMQYSGGTSTMKLAQQIREAGDNPAVSSVVLRIDSPGGAASYTPEVANAIREVAAKKRVVASATNIMASGAYWIGVAATEVYASPSTTVGSIGVYTVIPNYKEAYEKSGVKFAVLRAGSLKASGNPYEDLTPERLASLQKSVDDIYSAFTSAVAEYRKTTPSVVEKQFGQGSTFLAGEAQSRGMIDGVLTFEQVIARERDRTRVATNVPVVSEERLSMNPKLKAALFARGLIESIDADDATCQVALRGYRIALGKESVSEDEALKLLMGADAPKQTSTENKTTASPDVVDTSKLLADERYRIAEIKTRGRLLGVSDDTIETAVSDGTSIDKFVMKATDKLAEQQTSIRIVPGEAQADKFAMGAGAALCKRYEGIIGSDDETEKNFAQYGGTFRNMRTIDMVRAQNRSRGIVVENNDPVEEAKAYLEHSRIFASAGTVNSRGAHPDLLSALTRKALTAGAVIAETSFQEWCEKIGDLPDFKPSHFVDVGVFKALDAIQEREKFTELQFESKINSWIKADRYGNKVGLTTEMITDDSLDGFARELRSLMIAARMTLQKNVLILLNANPVMLDNNAFFSAAHNNLIDVGSGGVPSTTQLKSHRLKHRLAVSFGAGEMPMGAALKSVLVPATLEENALQVLSPLNMAAGENSAKATDANINTFRGKVNTIIDPYLDAYSTAAWYSMVDKMIAAPIIYAYQTGYGSDGRREDWYDPESKTRWVSNEIRFGVALSNWRSIVKNAGS